MSSAASGIGLLVRSSPRGGVAGPGLALLTPNPNPLPVQMTTPMNKKHTLILISVVCIAEVSG